MDRNYGGVIWTNHALQRLQERNVKQGDAWAAWSRPDTSKYDPQKGAWVYRRAYYSEEVEIVAKKNERGKWIILSVWAKPIKPSHKKEENKSLLQKIFNFLK